MYLLLGSEWGEGGSFCVGLCGLCLYFIAFAMPPSYPSPYSSSPSASLLRGCSPHPSCNAVCCGWGPASAWAPYNSVPCLLNSRLKAEECQTLWILHHRLQICGKNICYCSPKESQAQLWLDPRASILEWYFPSKHKGGRTWLVSLSLITEPIDLLQLLHLCHRDKEICLSL